LIRAVTRMTGSNIRKQVHASGLNRRWEEDC